LAGLLGERRSPDFYGGPAFWTADGLLGELGEEENGRMRELQELMAGILMCEPGTLPPESTPLRDIKGWDSLKHVLLVVGLEKHLNAQLTAEEIQGIVTLADVARVLRQKGVDA
jgi:acyl carrier protein